MEDEDEVDGDHIDYESTDSMASTAQLPPGFITQHKKVQDGKSPYLLKRSSTASNGVYFNARSSFTHQNSQQVRRRWQIRNKVMRKKKYTFREAVKVERK